MKIYNASCEEVMDNLISEGVKIPLIVTDPPYDIKNTKAGGKSDLAKSMQKTQNELVDLDICGSIDYNLIIDKFIKLQDKINIYIWCNKSQIPFYLNRYVIEEGCSFDIIKWVKSNPVPAYCNKYTTDTEYCLYFRKGGYCMPSNSFDASTLYQSPINNSDKNMYDHPTILKSGETWVAEYQGVDYLFIPDGKTIKIGTSWDAEGFEDLIKSGLMKPISEIEITDDIAKLRPMVHLAGSQGINRELYAVVRDVNCIIRAGIHKASAVEIHDCRLATVKDLTEGV